MFTLLDTKFGINKRSRQTALYLCSYSFSFWLLCVQEYLRMANEHYTTTMRHTSVCTSKFLCLRIFKMLLKMSNFPVSSTCFSCVSRTINVPVRPTPALKEITVNFYNLPNEYVHFRETFYLSRIQNLQKKRSFFLNSKIKGKIKPLSKEYPN